MIEIGVRHLYGFVKQRSKYFKSLNDDFGKTEFFADNIQRLLLFTRDSKINPEQLNVFLNNQENGIIYAYFEENRLELLYSMFKLLVSDAMDYDELKSVLKQIYKNVMERDNSLSLLFEVSTVKLFLLFYISNRDRIHSKTEFHKHLTTLRNALVEIRNEICTYNMFNRDFHTSYLDKSYIFPSLDFISSWETIGERVHSFSFPFSLFKELVGFFNTASSLDKELDIIDYFENRTIWSVDDIMKPVHSIYLPFIREEVRSIILKTIAKKSKQTRDYLLKEKDDLDRQILQIKNDVTTGLSSFSTELTAEINDSLKYPINPSIVNKLNSNVIDFNRNAMGNLLMANKLSERFAAFQKKSIKNEQIRNITYEQLIEIYYQNQTVEKNEVFLSMLCYNDYRGRLHEFFDKYKPYIIKLAKKCFDDLKKDIELTKTPFAEQELELIQNLFSGARFQKKFNIDFVESAYREIMDNLVYDLVVHLLVSSVKVVNEEYAKEDLRRRKEAIYISTNLVPKGNFYIFNNVGEVNPQTKSIEDMDETEISKIIQNNFTRVVSSLVYDVRGSTFMSSRLNNSDKQKFIMKKFQNTVIPVIKNNNGIPLKETGDGGICVFCNNSKDLYRNIYKESVSSKNVHIRHSIATGTDIILKEYNQAGQQAVSCSRKLLENAEKFIKDNYINYREWFFDVQERKVMHEGIEYALLPPEFKSLFRMGIGISSGIAGKDMTMGINAFGDIDVYGINVNEAKLLSNGKDPNASVVIIDHVTLFNMLLNSDYFEFDESFYGLDSLFKSSKIFSSVIRAEDAFIIENAKIRYHALYFPLSTDKDQSIQYKKLPERILMDGSGKLYCENVEVKILYQVDIL